jgi:hypothetical protein
MAGTPGVVAEATELARRERRITEADPNHNRPPPTLRIERDGFLQ